MSITEMEEIFDKEAAQFMKSYNSVRFREDYKTLFVAIIRAMLEANMNGYKEGMEECLKTLRQEDKKVKK